MAYTVKKLRELSGVTVRALHFYEEAGLLNPAFYGENGYRYYEGKQLLQLQQILFFKQLGFSIKQIQSVMGRSDFDQLAALYSHKKTLMQEWKRIGRLLKTIDKTILHVKGEKIMKEVEIYDGFFVTEVTKGKGRESYSGAEQTLINNLKDRVVEKRSREELEKILETSNDIYGKVVLCIEKGLEPGSKEVQCLLKRHCEFSKKVYKLDMISKEFYEALAQLCVEHPAFRKQLDGFHSKLAKFMAKAMYLYAERELT